MRTSPTRVLFLIASFILLSACSEAGTAQPPKETEPPQPPAPAAAAPAGLRGMVLETFNSGGYTYVLLQAGEREVWAAGPETAVKLGDQITVTGGTEMRDFHSPSLNRTFESIWFAQSLAGAGAATAEMPAGHGGGNPHGQPSSALSAEGSVAVGAGSITKAKDGYTIAEIFAGRGDLVAHQVTVRGRVVKYNAQIMGRNWLHIQDGTGGSGQNDLVVTSATDAKVGNVVLITGTLAVDKDFGAGYKYDAIVEDARITVEE